MSKTQQWCLSVQQENKLNNIIFLFIAKFLLVMIEHNFRPVYYIWSTPYYTLVKMVFLTLIFLPLSQGPTHAHYKQRGNKNIFICSLEGVCNPPQVVFLPENVLLA